MTPEQFLRKTSMPVESSDITQEEEEVNASIRKGVSNIDISSHCGMLLDHTGKIETYPMKQKPRGKCVIISNEIFRQDSTITLKNRSGTLTDRDNLVQVFKWLEYEVEVHDNLEGHQMWKVLNEYSQKDHTKYDSFVVCVLTHGSYNGLYGVDGKSIPVTQLIQLFSGVVCPSLGGKPKIFIMQACRGSRDDEGYQHDSSSPQEDYWEKLKRDYASPFKDPNETDFFIGYATPPGKCCGFCKFYHFK